VSVFLRWGVFGILGVAALLYAYNASKRLAQAQVTRAPASQAAALPAARETSAGLSRREAEARPTAFPAAPARCEEEVAVARRAIDMRKQGEPLDRLLRIQEIAWQESPGRRARLEQVATQWFNRDGEIGSSALRAVVVNDCQQHPPAP
jgi:hypothetical protein